LKYKFFNITIYILSLYIPIPKKGIHMNTKIGILTILVLVAGTLSMIGILGLQMADAQYGQCKQTNKPDSVCKRQQTGGDRPPGQSPNPQPGR
jgi:hypothetical protein